MGQRHSTGRRPPVNRCGFLKHRIYSNSSSYCFTESHVLMKLLCTYSNTNPDYGDTRFSSSTWSCGPPELQSHGIYSIASIHLQKSLQLERRGFCVQECSLPIKSALFLTAVAFREISSTAALMKLLLPIEIAVYELQATRRPTIAGLLLQNYVIQVALLLGVWNSGRCTGRRPPLCSK